MRLQFSGRAIAAVVEVVDIGEIRDLDKVFAVVILRQKPAKRPAEFAQPRRRGR